MKKYFFFLIVIYALSCNAEKWGTIVLILGDVNIIRNSKAVKITPNMSIMTGDKIKTGEESVAHIAQTNGTATIKITEKTEFEIQQNSTEGSTKAIIWDGGVISSIKKLISRKKEVTFSTPTATACIRGTVFSLRYSSSSRQTELSVYKGLVDFLTEKYRDSVGAGQRAVTKGKKIRKMDISSGETDRIRQKEKWTSIEKRKKEAEEKRTKIENLKETDQDAAIELLEQYYQEALIKREEMLNRIADDKTRERLKERISEIEEKIEERRRQLDQGD